MKRYPDMPIVTQEEAEQDPVPSDARIVVPSKEDQEIILARAHNRNRCGACQHFLLRQGQAELLDQQLFNRLYEELDHDPAWYGRTDLFGICDQWDNHMCSIMSPAVIPNQFLDSSIPYDLRDNPVPCPVFLKKQTTGVAQSKRSFVGKRTNYEE